MGAVGGGGEGQTHGGYGWAGIVGAAELQVQSLDELATVLRNSTPKLGIRPAHQTPPLRLLLL